MIFLFGSLTVKIVSPEDVILIFSLRTLLGKSKLQRSEMIMFLYSASLTLEFMTRFHNEMKIAFAFESVAD